MNKGAIFSHHRPGDEERLGNWLSLTPGTAEGAVSRALAKLPPGHRLPLYPPARAWLLSQAG